MKKIILIILVCFTVMTEAQTNGKNQFLLKGNIVGLKDGWLFLYYENTDGKRVTDSTTIKNSIFSFQGKVREPSMAHLRLKEETRNEKNTVDFFIEPSAMTVTLAINKFKEAKFTGSKAQVEYALLNKMNEPVMKQLEPLYDEYNAANNKYITAKQNNQDESTLQLLKDNTQKIHEKLTPYQAMIEKNTCVFFNTHPQSAVTANMLIYYVSSLPLDTLKRFYSRLGTSMQQTTAGKNTANEITKLVGGSPGSPAKKFSTVDINGNPLSLSDFRGKYVLLDFWASWCGPCRKGNPHLKELYARYKDKGMEIIGISDDDSKPDAWHKAVEKDQLPWHHILRGYDAKRKKNEPNEADIHEKYGVQTLPTKILIDPNGVIIGRYSEEEEPLDKKLEELFK